MMPAAAASAAAVLKGSHNGPQIMLEHGGIACCRAAALRQGVGKQASADLQPGLLRNLLDQGRAGDVLDEQRAGACLLEMGDEGRKLACRRLRLGIYCLLYTSPSPRDTA